MRTHKLAPALYIVPTPIGNLQDITLRAIDTLKQVHTIACEDTRVTAKLLSHFDIKTNLICYNDFSDQKVRDQIVELIRGEQTVALVSDAGTPLISDPGYKLVKYLANQNIAIESLPGASSVITALTLSAMPTDQFSFLGFLPNKKEARRNYLLKKKHATGTLVWFETCKRIVGCLDDLLATFGNRQACLLRELTKTYQQVMRGTIEEIITTCNNSTLKGELVLVVEGLNEENAKSPEDFKIDEALNSMLKSMPVKEASNTLAKLTGLNKRDLYQRALELKNEG